MNFEKLQGYLDKLAEDIYPQPYDSGHYDWSAYAIHELCPKVNTVLDVGCGMGFCEPLFRDRGIDYIGCTLGEEDYQEAVKKGYNVYKYDMSDILMEDNETEMVFARHVLEHSPMPLITLMEWKRVTSKYIFLIMPAPEYWTYRGRNHYYVMNKDQLWNLFEQVGLSVVKERDFLTSNKLFMKHYMPEVKERDTLTYPGRPIPVEYWYLLEVE